MGNLDKFLNAGEYKRVAANATNSQLGATGAPGDYLDKLIIIPATTAAGNVTLTDGVTAMSVFVAGTLADLSPITIPFGIRATGSGGFKITTAADVSVFAVGNFT
jgi:hypothetical protein